MNAQKLIKPTPKLVKRPQAEERYNMSWNMILKAARDSSSIVRMGRSMFINVTILDKYFDSISGDE